MTLASPGVCGDASQRLLGDEGSDGSERAGCSGELNSDSGEFGARGERTGGETGRPYVA